jgi:Zn finger protein HypA/HybF involved in hydrogenase expression
MPQITLKGYLCERCDDVWLPKDETKDKRKVCPKCKSTYWDIPRGLNVAQKQQPDLNFKEKEAKVTYPLLQ